MSRPPNVYPNGSMPGSAMSSSSRLVTPQLNQRPRSPGSNIAMSRAERFEDEKRRIIESCFAKLNEKGELAESYITHIRIQEDSQHPSTPPPPDSSPDNKKPRLIIIAVRSTGRVRMHKARENNNGSFSIGKTWNLEELSAIEIFGNASAIPSDRTAQQHKAWAGTTGFIVTITKPYYWQAGTSKEKDFFIASTVKIYSKYTQGNKPDLRGFDEREKAMILGNAQTTPDATRAPSENREVTPTMPQPPFAHREQSRDESRYRGSPGPPSGSGPSSRLPSESPASRFGSQPPSQPPSLPVLSVEQERSLSRDGKRNDLRVGTAGAPPERIRSPNTMRSGPQSAPNRSPFRPSETQGRSPGTPSSRPRDMPLPFDAHKHPRQREVPHSYDGVAPDQNGYMPSNTNGADSQINQSTRQRWQAQPPEKNRAPSPQPPQLPFLETSTSTFPKTAGPPPAAPFSAVSETSPVDLGDSAAISALTSYWGPEPQVADAPSPNMPEPVSPPTPERSRRRPPIETKPSEMSFDLRPAPLNQSRKISESEPQRVVREEPPTPQPVQLPEVKPLQVQNKSEPQPQQPIPGAFSPALLQATPDATPAATPAEERIEDDVIDEQHRPGLGPMFKKKAIADRFKKAANAASAFKPRPGGAAEKILRAKAEREGEPDGITGVVPRPQAKPKAETAAAGVAEDDFAVKATPAVAPSRPEIVVPAEQEEKCGVQLVDDAGSQQLQPLSPPAQATPTTELTEDAAQQQQQLQQRSPRPAPLRTKRRSKQQEKYLASLQIDRSLLEGRGLEFESLLSDFGFYQKPVLTPTNFAELETSLKREQGRLEAGNWLASHDAEAGARESRVADVESLLDCAIAECDELDGLLTLYSVELSSLNEDVAFIEAQSQGLQVQSANQKLLHSELRGLVDTLSLDRNALAPLQRGDLANPHSLEEVEASCGRVWTALRSMDAARRGQGVAGSGGRPGSSDLVPAGADVGMAALRAKRAEYERACVEFCQRFAQFLEGRFGLAMAGAKGRLLPTGSGMLNAEVLGEVRAGLWMYGPLLLFTRARHPPAWQALLREYAGRANGLYADAFKEYVAACQRSARPVGSGEDADVLFTTQERDETAAVASGPSANAGALASARKMTVKRSQTLAKTLRNAAAGDRTHGTSSASDRLQTSTAGSNLPRSGAFNIALEALNQLVSREQNFLMDLFHAHSLSPPSGGDFLDACSAAPPTLRRGTNPGDPKPHDLDRDLAARVQGAMEATFGFFPAESRGMLDWAINDEGLQSVGCMVTLAKHAFFLHGSSQEFLAQVVGDLLTRVKGRWGKFVDEQVRAIEETKVKIKKRKGVLRFVRVFPAWSGAVEGLFAGIAGAEYTRGGEGTECVSEVRRAVDEAYERVQRAMMESLRVIAKEEGSAVPGGVGRDEHEEKERLNFLVLMIENMNHWIEEVDDGGRDGVLREWKRRAGEERQEALEAYVGRVVRRPLGKILDFLDTTDSLVSTSSTPADLTSRPSHSRKALRALLKENDSAAIRRGIDALRKRIEKHFGDGDDEALARSLVVLVSRECEREYERTLERLEGVVAEFYAPIEGEKSVEVEWGRGDVQAGFRR